MSDPLRKRLAVAIEACQLADAVLLKHFNRLKEVKHKPDAGLVTEADVESEQTVQSFLKKHYPHDAFVGEESGLQSGADATSGRWICDPLDGTTNYVNGFDYFGVSLAYVEGKETLLGVTTIPRMGRTFHATKGGGSFLNGERISVRMTKSRLSECFLATGFSYSVGPILSKQMKLFETMVRSTTAVRRPGAACLDLAFVSAGVFDGFWEYDLQPWDLVAGELLVREAGGLTCNERGQPYSIDSTGVIAGSPKIFEELKGRILEN